MLKRNLKLWTAVALLLAACAALAGNGPELKKATIDNGGGVITGGTLVLNATIGQPDAGTMVGNALTLQGGFWATEQSNLIFKNGFE